MDSKYKSLRGCRIVGYDLLRDHKTLILTLGDGRKARLATYGDCCSSSWIESLDTPENLKGEILDVEDIDMPDRGHIGTDKFPDVECVRYYGLKITTDHGHCVIDYRNSSNGYYGGWIDLEVIDP